LLQCCGPETDKTRTPITANVTVRSKNGRNDDSEANRHLMDKISTGGMTVPLEITYQLIKSYGENILFRQNYKSQKIGLCPSFFYMS
jgi:hypothetical protein